MNTKSIVSRVGDTNDEWSETVIYDKDAVFIRGTNTYVTVLPVNTANGSSAFNLEFFVSDPDDDSGPTYQTSKIATTEDEIPEKIVEYVSENA